MDIEVIQQFLNFFQDFINLCQLENWPDNDTTEVEIRNAFQISQHVEKCLDKLQKENLLNEFLSVLNSQDNVNCVLKNCLADPSKYILAKIIHSNTKITQMDNGFKVFLELFPEEKLEKCLTDLMIETASKETLLKNLPKELPKEKILDFKSKVFLSEIDICNDSPEIQQVNNLDTIELLVVSLLNHEPKYCHAVKKVVDYFLSIILSKDNKYKKFWNFLFKVEDQYLIEMCVENGNIFVHIVEALLDCGKLMREHMSAESFYIHLSYSELANVVQRICHNDSLKIKFFEIASDYDTDLIQFSIQFNSNVLYYGN